MFFVVTVVSPSDLLSILQAHFSVCCSTEESAQQCKKREYHHDVSLPKILWCK